MDVPARIELLKAEVAAYSAVIDREGYFSEGARGQVVAHPAVTQRHHAIALLHKLEARLPPEERDPLEEFLRACGEEVDG